jgi:hypothetical protein
MKKIYTGLLIITCFLLASCNEQISPSLQNSNSTSNDDDDTVVTAPEEYYFSVTNSSDTLLGYKLHKTGAGNYNRACEVRSTTEISSTAFRGDPATNDITCFFEAEEMSLFHSGFEFNIEASKNTCDFVGYSPFSFYDKIPGNSSATYYHILCMNDDTDDNKADTIYDNDPNLQSIDLSEASSTILDPIPGCNKMVVDKSLILPGVRESFLYTSDEDLCAFNYSETKCDIGVITINEVQMSFTPDDPLTPADETKMETVLAPRIVECGGSIHNCVSGPVHLMDQEKKRNTEVTRPKKNEDFLLNYSYDGLINKKNEGDQYYSSLKYYANYRRNLATRNIDYGTSADLTLPYTSVWDPLDSLNRIFDPKIMDSYANNMMLDGTTLIIDETRLTQEATKNKKQYTVPYAADPYLGIYFGGSNDNRVSPFYTFYCFDRALEIKSRIRMVVRDWDRIFPLSGTAAQDLELLSDLGRTGSSRQDTLTTEIEIEGELDLYNKFNDFDDWDDLIPMDRSAGAYNPATPNATFFSPTPTATYTDGWFNPDNFPFGFY